MNRWLAAGLAIVSLAGTCHAADRKPEPRDAAALFAQTQGADAVVEGPASAKHVLYVFFDANCFYCHLTWKALQPYEVAGLQVRWIPVAYQQPSSVGRAAAIMQAPDRVAALRINETGYDASKYDGGITPSAEPSHALAAQFEANTALMRAFGAPGTPLVVWKSASGAVRYRIGVPRLSELPSITGLPQQPVDDPDLKAFR